MSDWTSGYVADIGYTYGYYPELNPNRLRLAFLNAGLVPPEVGAACELGFGQGMSANVHAAASPIKWYGTDFNPAQAGFARDLASAAGSDARLYDDAFADFCSRGDLPDFDYIGLHGIWSWISDENRAVIVEFIRRKLKVGGVVYISYNTQPGWASFAPMRHLLTEHAEIIGSEGHGIVNRINGALEFAERLIAVNPGFVQANPHVADRFKQLKDQSRHYLAHEYFNRDWHPMHFSTMADWLAPAKISFACSAHYLDHIDVVNMTPDQQAFLKTIPDPMFRETVRDFIVNQRFRRDYWVKGARKLNSLEQIEALRAHKVILISHRADVSLKVAAGMGEASLNESVYVPILDVLADHQPRSLGQIETDVKGKGISFHQVIQAAVVLTGAGRLAAVQEENNIAQAKLHTDKLNAYLIGKSCGSDEISFLASPVTCGGVHVARFAQLFLLAISQGKGTPAEWAEFVWHLIGGQGQKLVRDGAALATDEENIAELTKQAIHFAEKQLPILKALQIN